MLKDYSKRIISLCSELRYNAEGLYQAFGLPLYDPFFLEIAGMAGDVNRYCARLYKNAHWLDRAEELAEHHALEASNAYLFGILVGEEHLKLLCCNPLMIALELKLAFLDYDVYGREEESRRNAAIACHDAYVDLCDNIDSIEY